MSNKEIEHKPHSEEYFSEARDFWWNEDFIKLMGERLRLKQVSSVLDVGCGIGHWGRALAPAFSPQATLVGVDREEQWVSKATELAARFGLKDKFHYQQGNANALDFSDGSFDLVTCQTVLIHLKSLQEALAEMLRVLKPGGIILAVEPNNFANRAVGGSFSQKQTVDEIMDQLRFTMTCERGKQNLGLGFNSVGDLIPGYLAELKAENIEVYLSDKASPYFPPYATSEQKANVELTLDWVKRDSWGGYDYEEAKRYYLAGGGDVVKFDFYWKQAIKEAKDVAKAIQAGTYHSAGGGVSYLISARKPIN